MTVENNKITQQVSSSVKNSSSSEDNFTSYLKESIETVEDVRIKYGVEQNVIDDFLNITKVGNEKIFMPKNIDTIYNPLTNKQATQNSITFLDDVTQESVTVELNEQNAAKLKEHFGSLENATEMVKKWYNDAAYGVGYLQNDLDKNGIISQEEALKLNSLVDLAGDDGYMSIEESIDGEENQKEFLNKFGFIDNINDFINLSISQDTNFDGNLSNAELLGDNVAPVIDAMLSKEDMDIFAFNDLISNRIKNIPSFDYSRMAQNSQDKLLSTILQEV